MHTPCEHPDQEFVVYFQKRTKIVRAKPDDHCRVYSIPINSAIKFVPLHKEDAKFSKSAWEGEFDNVADITKLRVLPLVSIPTSIHLLLSASTRPATPAQASMWVPALVKISVPSIFGDSFTSKPSPLHSMHV